MEKKLNSLEANMKIEIGPMYGTYPGVSVCTGCLRNIELVAAENDLHRYADIGTGRILAANVCPHCGQITEPIVYGVN